jgi:hypothetical protein
MRKVFIAMVAVTALTGAACSSNSSDTGGSPSGATTGASGATGSGCTVAAAVDLTGDDPFTVTIQGSGDQVTFKARGKIVAQSAGATARAKTGETSSTTAQNTNP